MQYALLIYQQESVLGPDEASPAMMAIVAKHMAFSQALGAARPQVDPRRALRRDARAVGRLLPDRSPGPRRRHRGRREGSADQRRGDRNPPHAGSRLTRSALEQAARAAGGRVIAALAARYRNLDLVEDAFAEACARAAKSWPERGEPRDPAAWLYRVADRITLDTLRRRQTRERLKPEAPAPLPTAEDVMTDDAGLIPDERLRLIFVCCHPALAPEARVALTLRLVCGLSTAQIAQAGRSLQVNGLAGYAGL